MDLSIRELSEFSQSYLGVWLSLSLSPLTNILISRKEFRLLFIIAMIVSVGILVLYIGVQKWGAIGAAIAVVLT